MIASLLVATSLLASPLPQMNETVKRGDLFPTFAGQDLNGAPLSTKKLKTTYTSMVVTFWFSGCHGCMLEMPVFNKLAPKLRKQGIALIGVNASDSKELALKTRKWKKMQFPTLIGNPAKTLQNQVAIPVTPYTVVIDSTGVVVDTVYGFDKTKLMNLLVKIGYKD